MARHRTRVRVSRSLRAVAVALVAAGSVTALFEADMGRAILLSSSTVALAPPALYLVLGLVLLRGAPLSRRLGWAVAACGVNAALALASGITLSVTHPMSFEGAMRRALWAFAPGPLIHLVAAPLVLLAWRSRVVPVRVGLRADPGRRSLMASQPAPPLVTATPDWDSVLRVPTPSPRSSASARAVFERGMSEPHVDPEPHRREGPGAIATAPAAPPLVALPSPPPVPSPAMTGTVVMTAPPAAPSAPVQTSLPVPAAAVPEPVTDVAAESLTPEEPVVRIPFNRIADQLPPDVFVLPPARLAESVREPHVVVVPCRLVLPQLGEGAVEIPWTLVDDQFPELALAMPKVEVRRRFPGWVLSLPMDEVVRQLPRDAFRVLAPPVDLSDIGQFPAPFSPEPPTTEQEGAAEATADAEPPAAVEPDIPTAPVLAEAPPPRARDETPAVVFDSAEPPAVSAPAPVRTPVPVEAPVVAATPAPAVPDSGPHPGPTQGPPPVPTGTTLPAVTADDEGATLGRTLALGLAPFGAFEWQARRVGGRLLVSFVLPAMVREPVDGLASAAAPLVDRLATWGIEQVTIRTTRLVSVLTPLGGRGCLAATARRGGPVAMLEMLCARAGRSSGDAPGGASPAIAFPTVATTPATTTNGHRAVGDAARALAAFGPLAMSVADAEGAAPSVYVFGGQDQAVLAGAARAVYETLVDGHDHQALGRLESVVLRRGREHAVLRPLRGHGGRPAVLAAAGEVALAGRAHRAVAQAAALLEAR